MGKNVKAPQLPLVSGGGITEPRSFLPVLHGKATKSLASMTGKPLIENPINNTRVLDTGEVKLVIEKYTGKLGVSTHKLFNTAVMEFTNINHTGEDNREVRSTSVFIPLREYISLCGVDIEIHETDTPEEAEKEAKRAKNALDNARKKIKKDLEFLFASSLTWSEKVKSKKTEDFVSVRLLEAIGIKNGYIQVTFAQRFADYLILLPIGQYSKALLGIDERNPNAYSMGLKIDEHYNMDNNIIQGTAQLLKVKTLLAVTSLPSIEDVREQRTSWEKRIKEPFENSLDALTACGFLEDWEYCKPKGEAMTDEEATALTTYEIWSGTLIKFTLKDAPDHTARLEAKKERQKARQEKQKKKKKE